jgi:hypothetical protein
LKQSVVFLHHWWVQSGSSKWHFRGGSCGDMLLRLVNRTKEIQDLSLGHPDSW